MLAEERGFNWSRDWSFDLNWPRFFLTSLCKKKKSRDLRVGKKDLTTEGNNGEVKGVPWLYSTKLNWLNTWVIVNCYKVLQLCDNFPIKWLEKYLILFRTQYQRTGPSSNQGAKAQYTLQRTKGSTQNDERLLWAKKKKDFFSSSVVRKYIGIKFILTSEKG